MSKDHPNGYVPPFTVSTEAINLIADISAQIERYAIRLEQADGLRLRKVNRVKTIHSSLAIEGNHLSESEVEDILDGRHVIAPLREIVEVKNAIAAYDLYPQLDAFKEKDLLRAHGVMMQGLVDNAGHYRRGNVGVFGRKGLVHLAPPAERVPQLMGDLFHWLKKSKDHLLIRSCVFHYEFEFIHPFIDGNGRMGRLWQTLIMGKLSPVFEHLPVENMVYANQQKYYDAIGKSSHIADCGPFIDFMLREILNTLRQHQGRALIDNFPNDVPNKVPNEVPNKVPNKVTSKVTRKLRDAHPDIANEAWEALDIIIENPEASAAYVARIMGVSDRMIRKHIRQLREAGIIRRIGPNKGGKWEVVDTNH